MKSFKAVFSIVWGSFLFLILAAPSSFALTIAQFDQAIPKQGVTFGVGSTMSVVYSTGRTAQGIFLGRLMSIEGGTKRYMFFDVKAKTAVLFEPSEVSLEFNGKKVRDRDLQQIAEPVEQYDNTCSAYAVVYFLRQLHLNGFEGTGKLGEMLNSRAGIQNLMARAINDYYLNPRTASFQVVYRKLADEVGMKCRKVDSDSPEKFISLIEKALVMGSPVLLEFNLGPDMVNTDHIWRDYGSKESEDRRLWIPRARGERESGGHAIVVDEVFSAPNGRLKFLIGDSDWNLAPRIWDVESYLLGRKESGSVSAHVCFQR